MHAGTAIHDDIAFVADRIARRIALGEQRGDRVAPAQVATLAYPADFVVLAAAGPEFGEVHLAGEDPLLLGGQASEDAWACSASPAKPKRSFNHLANSLS